MVYDGSNRTQAQEVARTGLQNVSNRPSREMCPRRHRRSLGARNRAAGMDRLRCIAPAIDSEVAAAGTAAMGTFHDFFHGNGRVQGDSVASFCTRLG